MISLRQLNALSNMGFVDEFGDVAEHSSWVAERAFHSRPFDSREAAIVAFTRVIDDADPDLQLKLLRAHPDLAGRAARAGGLSADSTGEQESAGLDQLSDKEFERFATLNSGYQERFKFPFILAVKGATKEQILSAFEERISNSVDVEFATALQQVKKIIRFRLEDRVSD